MSALGRSEAESFFICNKSWGDDRKKGGLKGQTGVGCQKMYVGVTVDF